VACKPTVKAHVKQSRFLPIGSSGDAKRTWQIPICIVADGKEYCTQLADAEADVPLGDHCPGWVFPNADAAGYYRFTLAPGDLANLRKNGLARLSIREKVAYAGSLRGAYARATTPMSDVLDAVAPLAREADPALAEEPMGYVGQAREWLYADPLRAKVERYGRDLYAPAAKKLGWDAKSGEDDQTRTLRASVVSFIAGTGRDRATRDEAKRRGLAYIGFGKDGAIHDDAVDPNLAGLALAVVGEEADRATWDAMKALLQKSVDETVRGRLLGALGAARSAELSPAARALALDPTLRDSEVLTPLSLQLAAVETREATWAWIKDHYDDIRARLPQHRGSLGLVGMGRVFCDEAHAADVEAFFTPKIDSIDGGPRTLAGTLEDIRLCAARRKAQEKSARDFFRKR